MKFGNILLKIKISDDFKSNYAENNDCKNCNNDNDCLNMNSNSNCEMTMNNFVHAKDDSKINN